MRFFILPLAGIFLFSTTAEGHPPRVKPSPSVTISWSWVSGHWHRGTWVSGHWLHPSYGKSHRSFVHGPPPARPNRHAHWVPGHWERRGNRAVWVSGHWSRPRR